jgi:hypothetical protein
VDELYDRSGVPAKTTITEEEKYVFQLLKKTLEKEKQMMISLKDFWSRCKQSNSEQNKIIINEIEDLVDILTKLQDSNKVLFTEDQNICLI